MKSCIRSAAGITFLLLASYSNSARAQDFQAFLTRVNSLPDSQRTAVIDSFMSAMPSFPFIEKDSVVHFIYRGTASNVSVPGDANDWQVSALPMTNIGGTNLWYVTQIYPADARLEYKYVINGSTWLLDPLNPHQIMEGLGPNSELRMPDYVPPPEVQYYADIQHGSQVDSILYSSELSNSRKISVYLPPGYTASPDSFPVVYFQDGSETISLENAENVIDYLTAHDLIRPVIAVFVPYVNRTPEYEGSQVDSFMAFFVNDVVRYVDSKFRTVHSPQGRAVIGASYGGNISLWLGSTYPDVFGNVGAQSSYVDPAISTHFQDGNKLDLKIYMDLGTFDIPSLVPMVRAFVQILKNRGYDYEYHQYDEGHSWGNWRAHVRNALMLFFPPTQTGLNEIEAKPANYSLEQNFPNPFNPSTTITYRLFQAGFVSLKVYDVLGREVETLVKVDQAAGKHSANFGGPGLAGGVYLYRLTANGHSETKKMIVLK